MDQRVVISGMKSIWRPVTHSAPQGLILGPAVFNVFTNVLDDVTEDSLDKFEGDKKTRGMAGRVDVCGDIQRDFRTLKVCVNRNLTMFRGKCGVLHIGRNNLRHQYEPGADQLAVKQLSRKGP